MKPQQLMDHFIIPALKFMGGRYDSVNARFLLLITAAMESECGYFVKQEGGGPALGIWQMEPDTHADIWRHCDALQSTSFSVDIESLGCGINETLEDDLIRSPIYACAMARLKYVMDKEPLPNYNDLDKVYDYYKRIYNTEGGASTRAKFYEVYSRLKLASVKLKD